MDFQNCFTTERRIKFPTKPRKGKGRDICYSATYMSQIRDLWRFTISELAAD